MRKITIAPGEYYHIFNRSVEKKSIFLNSKDWARFLFLILYFQSPLVFRNISRRVDDYIKYKEFSISDGDINEILDQRYVELVSFVIMPNHFHLLVKELEEGGIAKYLQRIQEAYAKYFNLKYGHAGHLFQGTYRAVLVENNQQLLHLSNYIHRNPREIKKWSNKEYLYPWSSYQDHFDNRWGDLLKPQIITEQFSSVKEYKNFIQTSKAKEVLDIEHLI